MANDFAPIDAVDVEAALRRQVARPDLAERLDALHAALGAGAPMAAWLVGGSVRDLLLASARIADLDVAVDGDSLRLATALAEAQGWTCVVLDEQRGVVRVVSGRDTYIDIARLVGGSIAADLVQRDLTINAMALPVVDGEVLPLLIDPKDGAADLSEGLVRLTSEQAVIDDPLRLLRVFRFSTSLGFIVVPETLEAVERHAARLEHVAAERVLAELAIILSDAGSSAVLMRMDEVGLLEAALPEIAPMRGVGQNEYHHLDVLQHSLLTLERLERLLGDLESVFGGRAEEVEAFLRDPIAAERQRLVSVKLAALFHDAGKPGTRSTELGRTTFYAHNVTGADIAQGACRRLRLSRTETDEVVFLVHDHMVPGDVEKALHETEAGLRDAAPPSPSRSVARYVTRRGERSLALALIAVADSMAMAGPLADPHRPERLRRFARLAAEVYYGDVRERLAAPRLVSGDDLAERFGMDAGPEMGRVLAAIREMQLEGRLTDREQALIEAQRLAAESRRRGEPPETS